MLGRVPIAGDTGALAHTLATGPMRGAFLRSWRVMAIDGFDVDVPDTPSNAEEFGYAGSGENRAWHLQWMGRPCERG